jgi:uncharacterized protein (DUF1330 family)
MNHAMKLTFAVLGGVLIGAFGIEATRAQSKPPAFVVAEFEVTDPVGWKTYTEGARANPSGKFLVRAAKGSSFAGEQPKTITIVQFASVEEAIAFDASPAYTALKPIRDKSSNWRSYVVEGLSK